MWKQFAAGVAAGVAAVIAVNYLAVRPWGLRWGATAEEAGREMPGDSAVPDASRQTTRAISIHAPASTVWQWLVQMGQGRGGFYSYDWLESLLGSDTQNANRILSGYQSLKVGDEVRFHPKLPPMRVTVAEPGRALAFNTGWAFLLRQTDAETTRLIVRSRWTAPRNRAAAVLQSAVYEPAQFLMERKLLLGIKERAEREARAGERT
jgi:hypothetical protein